VLATHPCARTVGGDEDDDEYGSTSDVLVITGLENPCYWQVQDEHNYERCQNKQATSDSVNHEKCQAGEYEHGEGKPGTMSVSQAVGITQLRVNIPKFYPETDGDVFLENHSCE
jgi:hypothetical protein